MIGLAVFGLVVLVAPAVIVLGGLALVGLVVASLSRVDDAEAAGVRAALISPLPGPA
jgi:ABC-type Fe3+-siderophore transport system permease subunit